MTKWGLGFAPVGDTYVVRFDDDQVFALEAPTKGKPKKKVPVEKVPQMVAESAVVLEDERIRFIDQELAEGDEIYTEMGGSSGPLLLRAYSRGINVFRVPVIDIPLTTEVSDADDQDSNKSRDQLRRARTLAIVELAKSSPEKFYEMSVTDAQIARVSVMARNFDNWQRRIRIKAQTQLMQINRDLSFYPDSESRSLARMRKYFGEEDLLKETVAIEKRIERFINSELEDLQLYKLVFEPIFGCGAITAARIIDVIQDIRRFPNSAKFRRYSGWFPAGSQGQIVRRRRGETMRYSTKLKQAGNLFGMQVAQYHRGEEFYELYLETVEKEKAKEGISESHAKMRARRRVIGAFLDLIFREWWRFEVTAGTMDTLMVPVEEIPPGVAQSLAYWYPELGAQMQSKAA